jgi:CubicO group peptidase (beta-lactamase class C family)
MKHAMRMLLVVFALGCANLAAAQELTPVAKPEALGFIPARLDKITQTYQGYVDRSELPGAVMLIARDNQIVYLKAIGYQDRGKNIPMKTDAIFRLASVMTVVSVAV